ncbi:hypothetical protein D3C81_1247080 [compost metagenome]
MTHLPATTFLHNLGAVGGDQCGLAGIGGNQCLQRHDFAVVYRFHHRLENLRPPVVIRVEAVEQCSIGDPVDDIHLAHHLGACLRLIAQQLNRLRRH